MSINASTPALAPPPGLTSNFDDPPSIAWQNTMAMSIYIVVVTPFVAARIYTRARVQKSLWWDDAAQVLATCFLYAMAGMTITLCQYGGGKDLWNVRKSDYLIYQKIFGNTEIIARFGILFTKLSLLLLYLRYFCPTKTKRGKVFWATWAVIIFNVLYSLSLILVVKLQCVGKTLKPGEECVNENLVLVMASTINVITDVMILIIPIAAVWVMKMSNRLKVGLLVVFSVGFLVARLVYQVPQNDNKNRTVVTIIVLILAVAEQAIGQIAGCMPVLPSLYRQLFGDGQKSSQYYKSGSYGSYGSGRGDSVVRRNTADDMDHVYLSDPGYGPMSAAPPVNPSMHPVGKGPEDEYDVADRYRHFRKNSTTVHGESPSHYQPSSKYHQPFPTQPTRNEIGVARTVTVDISSPRSYASQ